MRSSSNPSSHSKRYSDRYNPYRKQSESSKTPHLTEDQQAAAVASHYNARPQIGVTQRSQSSIYRLKCFNNWVKSVLINKYARQVTHSNGSSRPSLSVLDFCCGKGGDLQKLKAIRATEVVGVDIADVSIGHATERYSQGSFPFHADFYALDCFKEDLFSRTGIRQFDLVTCQFAFHYCFESSQKAHQALKNISCGLVEGGYFVATIPDANWLVKKLRSLPEGELSFGNQIYKVTFEKREGYEDPVFGHKYTFELEDAIDALPEYLVHFPTLASIAREYGLEVVLAEPFHAFFEHERWANMDLLQRMKVVSPDGDMSLDEWEAAGIYMVCAFQKKSSK